MLTLEQIQKRLKICSISKVSDGAKVSKPSLYRIRDTGVEGKPEYATIKKLSDYFEEQEK